MLELFVKNFKAAIIHNTSIKNDKFSKKKKKELTKK